MSATASALKRALDVAVSAGALLALSPVLLGLGVAIRASMGTPVLFRQRRPGRNGRLFELVKFRTMRSVRPGEAESATDGVRLTALGHVLRERSLDELPTLWNVLKGDMSLVGPRPLLVDYLERYTAEQARRHEVRPGITGWAQINGRNALDWETKFALDVWYIDHWSLLLDAQIVLRTFAHVLKREGINHEGAATMPEFLGSSRRSEHARPPPGDVTPRHSPEHPGVPE